MIRLRRRETPLQFVLYPMIHVAQPSFYSTVTTRLRGAGVLVVEGIGGDRKGSSALASALTLSYRVLRFNRRAGLVDQDIDYAKLGLPVIRPDVTNEEFRTGWRRVPLAHRLLVWCVLPVVVLGRLFGGSRMIWSRSMEQHDLPSPDDEAIAEIAAAG